MSDALAGVAGDIGTTGVEATSAVTVIGGEESDEAVSVFDAGRFDDVVARTGAAVRPAEQVSRDARRPCSNSVVDCKTVTVTMGDVG